MGPGMMARKRPRALGRLLREQQLTRVRSIFPEDPARSTVEEELEALDLQISELATLLTELESAQRCEVDIVGRARRRLNTMLQRSYRAQQIARGLRVPRA